MRNKYEELREHFDQRWFSLKDHRKSWIPTWKLLAENFMPEADIMETDPKSYITTAGTDKQTHLQDGTGIMAVSMLASGMQSGLTSPSNKWFTLSTGDEELDTMYNVRMWLYNTEQAMLRAFNKSNFYNVAYTNYLESATFGTSATIMVADPDTIINCIQLTPGSYCLATNYRGFVDTLYREYAATAKQLVEQFGYGACSKSVQDAYDNNQTESLFNVMHIIEPNFLREEGKEDNTNLPFISAYYESDCSDKKFLKISGFREQPFFAPRWAVTCNNVYGYGPSRAALGHNNMLQLLQKDLLRGLAKQVEPPMVASSDVKRGGANTMPKGITYVDAQGGGFLQSAFQVQFDLQSLQAKINMVQDEIRQFFYNDLFMMQAMTSKRQTAYETEVKEGEKLRMLSPVIERLQYEYLDLIIDRAYGIMSRQGLIEQPPQELEGKEIKVEYKGLLARAQKMLESENISRVFAFAGNFAAMNPEIIDNLDFDNGLRTTANTIGVNPVILKDEQERDRIRQQRAQAQQQAVQQQQAMQGVEAAKLMSETEFAGDASVEGMEGF